MIKPLVNVHIQKETVFTKLFKIINAYKSTYPTSDTMVIIVSDRQAFDCIEASQEVSLLLQWKTDTPRKSPIFNPENLEDFHFNQTISIQNYRILSAIEFEHHYVCHLNPDFNRSYIAVAPISGRGVPIGGPDGFLTDSVSLF